MKKKQAKINESVSGKKRPVVNELPDSYLKKRPSWRFERCDDSHCDWCVTQNDNFQFIISKLMLFEGMTWDELLKATGGKKSGNKHHFIPISDYSKEAQKRAEELHLDVYEELFSISLEGAKKLFGILDDGVFHIVWYDHEHEICPYTKKHT